MPGAGVDEAGAERLFERTRQVREDAASLRRSLGELVEGSEGLLRSELERRPYLVLSLAASAGYVLGGGLPLRVARWAIDLGSRVLISELLQELIVRNTERRTP